MDFYAFHTIRVKISANIKCMEAKKKYWNHLRLPATAFGLIALFLCALYAFFGLFPFGEKTLAWGDMKQQVVPLMMDFKDILAGKAGFLLNFQNAGGMSFWGVFFFFLSSPFTFLAAVVEKGDMFNLVNVLVLIKLALSAATASYFFQEEQPDLQRGLHLSLSCSYALCGYGLLYYQNLVWLDALYLFPVLMVGFRRVISRQKAVLFTLSLAFFIVINYYLSYMVLIALVLMSAIFVINCVPTEKKGVTAGKIGAGAVAALLMTAVVWLPSLLQCLRSARTKAGLLESIQQGGFFTDMRVTLPMLLCTASAVVFPLIALRLPFTRKRKALLLSFLLTSLPLVIEPINKIWHTGSYQAFPARYGYIPLFLGLWIAGDVLGEMQTERVDMKRNSRIFAALFPLFLALFGGWILWRNGKGIASYTSTLWFDSQSFTFLAVFFLTAAIGVQVGVLLFQRKKISPNVMGWMMLGICLIQGAYHGTVLIGSAANVPKRSLGVLSTEHQLADTGAYRVKTSEKFFDVNLLGAAGYPTLNHYTSLTDNDFLHALKKLGYSSYWMETSGCCGTAISDALLSNRYRLSEDLHWQKISEKNMGWILPAGVLPESLPDGNRFSLENDLYRRILGENGEEGNAFNAYFPTEGKEFLSNNTEKEGLVSADHAGTFIYHISIGEGETLYFDAFGENTNRLVEPINGNFRIMVNGAVVSDSYPSQNCNGILKLGDFEQSKVRVEVQVKGEFKGLRSFGVYGLKSDKRKTLENAVRTAELRVEKSRILGKAKTFKEGQSLFLSVAYAPGMRAVVNGKQVAMRKVLDCFLEIPLESGENEIVLSYVPQGVWPGVALSLFGLSLCLLWFMAKGTRQGQKAALLWSKMAKPLLNAAFIILLCLTNVLPVLLWAGKLWMG